MSSITILKYLFAKSSRGAHAHKSHKDPNETQDVISAQLLDENETRIKSVHIREDGTVKPSK